MFTYAPTNQSDTPRAISSKASGRSAQVWGEIGEWSITSHFQPIFSLSHGCAIGHEALLRAFDHTNKPVAPPHVIAFANTSHVSLEAADQKFRRIHVENFRQALASTHQLNDSWLFLNIHPQLFRHGCQAGLKGAQDFMPEIVATGIDPRRIVVEVMEESVPDDGRFVETVNSLREMGCRIALDDFGAGHSNFDRIWKLTPEVVKLDRSFALRAAEDSKVRRILPRMVGMIHEAGSLVLLEGVETEEQALIALDADIDLVQGYYFARPAADPVDTHLPHRLIDQLWDNFDQMRSEATVQSREQMAPYLNAIGYAATLLEAGRSLSVACASFFDLAGAEKCYLLDAQGQQVHDNHQPPAPYSPLALLPSCTPVVGARWSRRPYFRRALEHFGKPQQTRPYICIASGKLCITVSVTCQLRQGVHVLCADVMV